VGKKVDNYQFGSWGRFINPKTIGIKTIVLIKIMVLTLLGLQS